MVITRKAAPGKRQFDDALNAYTTDPVSGAALDADPLQTRNSSEPL